MALTCSSGGIDFYSLDAPYEPQFVCFDLDAEWGTAYLNGNIAYVVPRDDPPIAYLLVFDISNLNNIVQIGRCQSIMGNSIIPSYSRPNYREPISP